MGLGDAASIRQNIRHSADILLKAPTDRRRSRPPIDGVQASVIPACPGFAALEAK
jgi:hypothetical protein